ncbi:MAG: endolytic transglycosylase MltG [Myxococcota bacterium]
MIRRIAVSAALASLLVAIVGGLAIRRLLTPIAAEAAEAPNALFVVSPGESLSDVARHLEQAGLVRSGWAVEWLARGRGLASQLRSGEYVLSSSLRPGEILMRIAEGRVKTYEVVVPEGFTARQIALRLGAAGLVDPQEFLRAARDPDFADTIGVEGPGLEGYLFPETYRIPRGLSPEAIARTFVAQFLAVWREIEELAEERGVSMQEVVTMASIIEKETGDPDERPLIASVFHNRLERGMRLETDPTVIYGIPDFDGNLRRSDLENADNPYNTYRIFGLPPGPIASPGADSLRAAVEPAETPYLYFVSRNDGTHSFSRTYREHKKAVDKHQRRRSR